MKIIVDKIPHANDSYPKAEDTLIEINSDDSGNITIENDNVILKIPKIVLKMYV